MSVTLDQALDQLNIRPTSSDVAEVQLYTDAATEWIDSKVPDTSPTPITLATLFLIEHLWESQRGPASTPLSDEMVEVSGKSYAIPNRVLEMIEPFRSKARPAGSFPTATLWPDDTVW